MKRVEEKVNMSLVEVRIKRERKEKEKDIYCPPQGENFLKEVKTHKENNL